MIPSRTVFNHRKWIYIELAITRAHSVHGPLVYQPPSSAYESRARAPMFSPFHPSMPCQPSSLLAFPTQILLSWKCYSSFWSFLRSFIIYFFSCLNIFFCFLSKPLLSYFYSLCCQETYSLMSVFFGIWDNRWIIWIWW